MSSSNCLRTMGEKTRGVLVTTIISALLRPEIDSRNLPNGNSQSSVYSLK